MVLLMLQTLRAGSIMRSARALALRRDALRHGIRCSGCSLVATNKRTRFAPPPLAEMEEDELGFDDNEFCDW